MRRIITFSRNGQKIVLSDTSEEKESSSKSKTKSKKTDDVEKLDGIQCQICFRPYSSDIDELTPRILTGCGHTLCQRCARKMPRTRDNGILCPFDRKTTQSVPDALPKNFAIFEMLGEKPVKKQDGTLATISEESCAIFVEPDIPCFEDPDHESTCYCTTCKADLCQSCFNTTHASRIFSKHEAIPISEKPLELPTCSVHPDSIVSHVCKNPSCTSPSRVFCEKCLPDHPIFHETQTITEAVSENQKILETLLHDLNLAENRFTTKLDTANNCAKSFERNTPAYNEKLKEIQKFFEEKKIEALEKLGIYVDKEKEKIDREGAHIFNGICQISRAKMDIEKMLKQRNNLYNAGDLIEKGKQLCNMEAGNGAWLFPFTPSVLTNDMSTVYNNPRGPSSLVGSTAR